MLRKQNTLTRFTAILCTVALLLSSFPFLAYADSSQDEETATDFTLDFEYVYKTSDGEVYYSESSAENWAAANGRGSHSETVTESDGNTAVRLTYDGENSNENYKANPVINIYNPDTAERFTGREGKQYLITFSYKVEETDGKELQFYIAPSNRWGGINPSNKDTAFLDSDMGPKAIIPYTEYSFTAVGGSITEKTNGYVTVSALYTARGELTGTLGTYDSYPIIILQTNGKAQDSTHTGNRAYASVLIDNISVCDYSPDFSLDFEDEYTDTAANTYYSDSEAENWSAANNRGSHAELVTEEGGNTAVRLTYDSQNSNENYNANAVMNIYDPDAKTKFMGEYGKKYIITFSYKVENTDDKELQLYIAPSNRWGAVNPSNNAYAFYGTDMGPKAVVNNRETAFTAVTGAITDTTDGYVTVSVAYTARGAIESSSGNAFDSYPVIILQTNGKTKDSTHTGNRSYASVLIDNISVREAVFKDYTLDFEQEYKDSSGALYYDSSASINLTSDDDRASHAEVITEEGGNKAMRMTYDTGRAENYKDNSVINLYDPNTLSTFTGSAETRYTITFSYKVENTDSREMQFYIVNCGRTNLQNTDCNLNNVAMQASAFNYITVGEKITEITEDYVTVKAVFVANGLDYPVLVLSTNNSTTVSGHSGTDFASVLIDNIKVENDSVSYKMFYNYNGTDRMIKVFGSDTFSKLSIPTRNGYLFGGWYKDAEFNTAAEDGESVSECDAVYVKWLGDGTAKAPAEITDSIAIDSATGIKASNLTASLNGLTYVQNSMLEQAASSSVTAADSAAWYGTYVLSAESTVLNSQEKFQISGIDISISPDADSVIFYAQLPDFKKSGAEWALALGGITLVQNSTEYNATLLGDQNGFSYLNAGSDQWTASDISAQNGALLLPSGFKGYIRLDFSALGFEGDIDLTSSYTLSGLTLCFNSVGGECGDLMFGGIFYAPSNKSDSTVMTVSGAPYELSTATSAAVNQYSPYSSQSDFSLRYSGTVGTSDATLTPSDTSALWAEAPVAITSYSGKKTETSGYMNTYRLSDLGVLMQPAVDTFMLYIEMPEYSSELCGLKLISPTVCSGNTEREINFSNSIYEYLDIRDGAWKIARAGADGELYAVTSGFTGYIKFDIKQMKGYLDVTGIDFTKPYSLDRFELAFNHVGGENGELVIGAVYSVIKDSDTLFLENGITGEVLCAKALGGDLNMDGEYSAEDLAEMKKTLLGFGLTAPQTLRANADGNDAFDIRDLIRLKKYIAGTSEPDPGDLTNGVTYKNIFTPDITSSNTPTVYYRWHVEEYDAVIEADTALNSEQKAIDFANEINNSTIADFEKTGIDKMCHVSTFIYANGNIYMSYYANTMSAAENPSYQVARFAYCPEDEPENKVILDIQSVGDDLYGQKVVGVYDTIIMQKENDDTYLYILWTANINGQYYRLWRTFNMKTEQLGEINVNRFKVGNVVNDFSTSGIKNALTANNIGYKDMFMDIGIMQKLSTRTENGETYYYTGAYSGNFTCIIKSRDLITWEYVAQPNEGANGTGFLNETEWENAVYVVGDKCYYFVRQWPAVYDSDGNRTSGSEYGILTYYDLVTGEWATPVLVGDSQSRSDFIMYNGGLYLFHAPTDRNHIGIIKVDTDNLADSSIVLQADMQGSCFYPFIQYNSDGELCMSYTVNRTSIRLASFTLSKYLD